MIADEFMKMVFLGAGGRRPGLWAMGDQAEPRCVLELPAGQSVYAIDTDAEAGSVAVGTRGGQVEVLAWPGGTIRLNNPSRRMFYQAAPVLAVCLVGEGRVAAADTSGRCLLWRFAEEALPAELPAEGGRICALLDLGGDQMAGLTEEGKLLLWDTGRLALCKVVEGPVPAAKSALVRLVDWPAQGAIVYPAHEGRVAYFSVAEGRINSWPAHQGDCYGLVAEKDGLLTVGRADGLLKAWEEPGRQASDPCRCGEGIIAAECVGFEDKLLLVDGSGSAGVYAQERQVMQITSPSEGPMFRSVAGPGQSQRQAFLGRQRSAQAQELCGEIRSRMCSEDPGGAEDLHRKLVDLGFDRVSLALRAQLAAQAQDLIAELAARWALADRLDGNEARSVGSLERLAELLVLTWRLQEAIGVYDRIRTCGVEAPKPDWLTRAVGLMAGSGWVARSEGSLEMLVDAADVMEQPFRGRWLCTVSDTLVFPQSGLTAEMLAGKYEEIRAEKGLQDLPAARAAPLWWVETERIYRQEAVFLQPSQTKDVVGRRLGIRLAGQDHQCLLSPCVVLDAGFGQAPADWRRHNRQVRRLCIQLAGADPSGLWPPRIQNTLKLAIRRLRTSWLWPWRR